MTTQTSQPNGDGQMLRGAQALRAAARNALTARRPTEPAEPTEPVEPVEPREAREPTEPVEPTRPVEPTGPVESTEQVAADGPDVRPEPPSAATTGWNEAGWHQNVRLLTGPQAEPGQPHEGEPPGRADMFAKRPEEPEHGLGAGQEACYGGAVTEEERESAPEFVSVELPVEAGAPMVTAATAYAGQEARPERERELGSASVEAGAPAPTGFAGPPEAAVEPDAADVPHSRGESWAMPAAEPAGSAGVDIAVPATGEGPSAPEAGPASPAESDRASRDEGVAAPAPSSPGADPAGPAEPADSTGQSGQSGSSSSSASSGIPAPVWDISVRAGSGAAVPARAALTFDSHRWSPLIVGEATHEIPVHLLFRDEGSTDPAAGRPRTRRGPAAATPVVPPVLAPSSISRPATPVDTKLVERPGPTLPGWAAALVGVAGLIGCLTVLWWVGAVPEVLTEMFGLDSNQYHGIGIGMWALLTAAVTLALFAFGGLGRGRVGHAWVLTLFGEYRGSVRRTGLLWVSPLLLRRRVDVRLRHWRSEPMPAVDANGTALRVVVLVVWRVRDTVRAALGVRDHEEYLREQVEAAMARVLSQLPTDAFHETAPTLRNAEAVGEALTRMLSAECRPVGLDVFSAQPTRIEYAPEISAAMQRSRIAAIDAKHRDTVLTSVVDAVDDTVHRLTSRGLVELDDYERKVLVKDLTVAFYTGRHGLNEGS
ncbi:SPFH domain-containing protein [Streptomyces niveus]|uniref:SPFH domain-containing protein n=1 Tax=Streptomyces niveus TaxID=193462 RepID=UPI003409858E